MQFYEFHNAAANLTIVTIRGTKKVLWREETWLPAACCLLRATHLHTTGLLAQTSDWLKDFDVCTLAAVQEAVRGPYVRTHTRCRYYPVVCQGTKLLCHSL